jgi:hypothetical protein
MRVVSLSDRPARASTPDPTRGQPRPVSPLREPPRRAPAQLALTARVDRSAGTRLAKPSVGPGRSRVREEPWPHNAGRLRAPSGSRSHTAGSVQLGRSSASKPSCLRRSSSSLDAYGAVSRPSSGTSSAPRPGRGASSSHGCARSVASSGASKPRESAAGEVWRRARAARRSRCCTDLRERSRDRGPSACPRSGSSLVGVRHREPRPGLRSPLAVGSSKRVGAPHPPRHDVTLVKRPRWRGAGLRGPAAGLA